MSTEAGEVQRSSWAGWSPSWALGWWIDPFSLVCGALALSACAYLAATFLCVEAHRAGEGQLAEDFRARALAAAVAVGALSLAALPLAGVDAPRLQDRLLGAALPLVLAAIATGTASLAALWHRRYRLARAAAGAAVAAVIWGWGVAQYPQLAGPDLTVAAAAAPHATLVALAIGGGAGLALLAPALWLLYVSYRARAPIEVDER